jgi:hypothetical protein
VSGGRRTCLALFAAGAAACGAASGPGQLRFHNARPVALVNDRRPIDQPDKSEPGLLQYYFRAEVVRTARQALTLSPPRPARDVNSLGNVPNSTWFTNRISGRGVTPEQIAAGPGQGGEPDRTGPWLVDGIKVGGAAIGFTIVDRHGDHFLIKFDERDHPETESSADVVVQRLVWAFGYNVPENDVVEFDCGALRLAGDAVYRDRAGNERPMTQDDLDRSLALVRPRSGRCRALSSRLLPGEAVGGVQPTGVREADRNDTVPHEQRRSLRGQRILAAWVDHTDMKPQNTFSSYDPERRYLTHYFLDFGKSLGNFARIEGLIYVGYRTRWGVLASLKSLASLGLWVAPWERPSGAPRLVGVGRFEASSFAPAHWTTHYTWAPFHAADRFDEYWAGVILMRFTAAHVRAAVAAGRYSDPRAARYITRVLLRRQRALGRHTLSRVAPFENFAARPAGRGSFSLCFDDLWIRHRFGRPGAARYAARSFDFHGAALGRRAATSATGHRVCLRSLAAGQRRDGYTIVEIAAARGSTEVPNIYVHLARDRSGSLRVIGLDRR